MSVDGTEELEAGRWIKRQVEAELGDSISGAWLDLIPEGASLPAVRFNSQMQNDVATVSNHIIMTRFVFQVVGVIQDKKALPLVDISKRIFLALHGKSGVTSNARILSCERIEPFGQTETDTGVMYRTAGGLYELYVQSLD